MDLSKLYSLSNEVFRVYRVIYRVEQKHLSTHTSILFFISLSISAVYGGLYAKLIAIASSAASIALVRRSCIRDALLAYLDLTAFTLLITLPALATAVVGGGGSPLHIAGDVVRVVFNVVSASSPTIAMAIAVGAREFISLAYRFSRFLGTLLSIILALLPKTVQHLHMALMARAARTLKPSRSNLLSTFTSSIADAVIYGAVVGHQIVLAVKARSFSDVGVGVDGRIGVADLLLTPISITVLYASITKLL